MKIINRRWLRWLFLYLACTVVRQNNLYNWNDFLIILVLDQVLYFSIASCISFPTSNAISCLLSYLSRSAWKLLYFFNIKKWKHLSVVSYKVAFGLSGSVPQIKMKGYMAVTYLGLLGVNGLSSSRGQMWAGARKGPAASGVPRVLFGQDHANWQIWDHPSFIFP